MMSVRPSRSILSSRGSRKAPENRKAIYRPWRSSIDSRKGSALKTMRLPSDWKENGLDYLVKLSRDGGEYTKRANEFVAVTYADAVKLELHHRRLNDRAARGKIALEGQEERVIPPEDKTIYPLNSYYELYHLPSVREVVVDSHSNPIVPYLNSLRVVCGLMTNDAYVVMDYYDLPQRLRRRIPNPHVHDESDSRNPKGQNRSIFDLFSDLAYDWSNSLQPKANEFLENRRMWEPPDTYRIGSRERQNPWLAYCGTPCRQMGPLWDALRREDPHGALSAIETGDRIDPSQTGIWSPLMAAAMYGYTSVVKALLDHGAEINAVTWIGQTALLAAALFGQSETVRLLLDRGADFNRITDFQRFSVLMVAAAYCDLAVVQDLVTRGADIHHVGARGRTALQVAESLDRKEVAAWLEEIGATRWEHASCYFAPKSEWQAMLSEESAT